MVEIGGPTGTPGQLKLYCVFNVAQPIWLLVEVQVNVAVPTVFAVLVQAAETVPVVFTELNTSGFGAVVTVNVEPAETALVTQDTV